MKVVHLSTSDSGGAGIAAVRLHIALLDQGVDSNLLTLHRFTNTVSHHTKYLPGAGYLFPFFRNSIYKMEKAMNYYGIRSLLHNRISNKYLKNRPDSFEHFSFPFSEFNLKKHPLIKSADIIHLHWVSDGFLDYNSFFPGNKKKLVWTLHDMNSFTGGCHHSDGCMKFRNDCVLCPQLIGAINPSYSAEILKLKLESFLKLDNNQMKIVTPSKWLGSLSESSLLFNRFPHSVIPNAINASMFFPSNKEEARRKLGLPAGKKIILFNAHHIDNPRKGFSFLLQALKEINSPEVLLCTTGHLLNNLDNLDIINLGYLTSEQNMALAYSAADVFVLPSMAENFPNTICESILCGTPVVAFNVGGIAEIVNQTNGILPELKDIVGLTSAIRSVLFEKEFDRTTISTNAASIYSNSSVANKYMDIYSFDKS